MNLFTASDIVRATGQVHIAVRELLLARVRDGFLRAYIVVPMGETIDSLDSVIAFEVVDPEVTG